MKHTNKLGVLAPVWTMLDVVNLSQSFDMQWIRKELLNNVAAVHCRRNALGNCKHKTLKIEACLPSFDKKTAVLTGFHSHP
jgi:hypothetical protein